MRNVFDGRGDLEIIEVRPYENVPSIFRRRPQLQIDLHARVQPNTVRLYTFEMVSLIHRPLFCISNTVPVRDDAENIENKGV
jgi:hypothetical protein